MTNSKLRYQETGNVHLDFHGATNTTIEYIVEKYGIDVLHQIFRKVGTDVYTDLKDHLMRGDMQELAKHWQYFFAREGADFDISFGEDEITMTVRHCTAWHHAKSIVGDISPHFCDQTTITNNAIAAGTPFVVDTEITGPGACRQIIRIRT